MCRISPVRRYSSGSRVPGGPSVTFMRDIVPGRLPETQAEGEARGERRSQLAPADHRDVFGRGDERGEPVDVDVEVPVVEPAEQALLDQLVEPPEVPHVDGPRVGPRERQAR